MNRTWSRMSIRYKSMVLIVVIILFFLIISIYLLNRSTYVTKNFKNTVVYYDALSKVLSDIDANKTIFDSYMRESKNNEIELKLISQINETNIHINELKELVLREDKDNAVLVNAAHNTFNYFSNNFSLWRIDEQNYRLYEHYYELTASLKYSSMYINQILNSYVGQSAMLIDEIQKESVKESKVVAYGFLFLMVGGVTLFRLLSKDLIKPILKLSEQAKLLSEGSFNIDDLEIVNQDEIGYFTKVFNEMKTSMRKIVETIFEEDQLKAIIANQNTEIYSSQKIIGEFELAVLQSQIKSHFLFNTLNIISRTARIEKAKDTEMLINSLSTLFRYNLKNKRSTVSLDQEVDVIKDYIKIQTIRFGDRIKFLLKVDEAIDLTKITMATFILQPLVENAVIHGIEPKLDGGKLRLKIENYRGKTRITVTDTGVGMNNEIKHTMIKNINKKHGSSIGLRNVQERIKILYPDSKFIIRTKVGWGTSVTILF